MRFIFKVRLRKSFKWTERGIPEKVCHTTRAVQWHWTSSKIFSKNTAAMAPCQPQKDSALNTEIESLKVNTNALILILKLSWIFLDLKRRGHGQGKTLMKHFLFGQKIRVKISKCCLCDWIIWMLKTLHRAVHFRFGVRLVSRNSR